MLKLNKAINNKIKIDKLNNKFKPNNNNNNSSKNLNCLQSSKKRFKTYLCNKSNNFNNKRSSHMKDLSLLLYKTFKIYSKTYQW